MTIHKIWAWLIFISFVSLALSFVVGTVQPLVTECEREDIRIQKKDHPEYTFQAPDPGVQSALRIFPCASQLISKSSKDALERILGLVGIITFWLGIMRIGYDAGLIERMAHWFYPIFSVIYPKIPKGHPALSSIMMNMSANMLGLDNAATPLGLKAMKDLQELNTDKSTASDAMVMFMVLNPAGITLIPTGVIAARASYGAADPADIFIPSLLGTLFSFLVGLVATSLIQKIPIFKRSFLLFVGGLMVFMGSILYILIAFRDSGASDYMAKIGSMLIVLVIVWFIYYGYRRGVNVYESFIEGAKDGFQISISILPYLIVMFLAITLLKVSGLMEQFVTGLSWLFVQAGWATEFIPALPVALMKTLNGGAARALMMDNMGIYGADSFVGRVSCVIQGSTETTLYVLSMYFGSVGISKMRYAPALGIVIDFVGAAFAIFLAYLFFANQ